MNRFIPLYQFIFIFSIGENSTCLPQKLAPAHVKESNVELNHLGRPRRYSVWHLKSSTFEPGLKKFTMESQLPD